MCAVNALNSHVGQREERSTIVGQESGRGTLCGPPADRAKQAENNKSPPPPLSGKEGPVGLQGVPSYPLWRMSISIPASKIRGVKIHFLWKSLFSFRESKISTFHLAVCSRSWQTRDFPSVKLKKGSVCNKSLITIAFLQKNLTCRDISPLG